MEACSRWKRLIMVNSMQANEAPQERMSAAWRLHKSGYEPRRGSVMVKTIDATTTDRLRRSPLHLGLSPSCARKRACMELTTICRFQRLKNPSFDFSVLSTKACPYVMMRFGISDASTGCKKKIFFAKGLLLFRLCKSFKTKALNSVFAPFRKTKIKKEK